MHWYEFQGILHTLKRRDDLRGLIRWSQYKRLSGARQHYQSQLLQAEMKLMSYSIRSGTILLWGEWAHSFRGAILPARRHYGKHR